MRRGVSDTAEFGDYVSGPKVVGEQTKEAMRDLLREIRSGAVAREWVDESESGGKRFERFRVTEREHPLEDVGRRLRERMVWLHEEA
jgi:ketol-acid reductoisomerase